MRRLKILGLIGAIAGCKGPDRPVTPTVSPLQNPRCAALGAPLRQFRVDSKLGDDSASGLCDRADDCHPIKSLGRAAELAQPGDVFWLAPGTYSDPWTLTHSGSAGAPIVFAAHPGDEVHLTGTAFLGSTGFVTFSGLRFDSAEGAAWLLTESGSHDLTLVGNAFNSTGKADSFWGLRFLGDRTVLCGNAFGSWLGDMVSFDHAHGALLENNDFSQSAAQHALVAFIGHQLVIRGNAFRNPWERAIHVSDNGDEDTSEDLLMEGNFWLASDWVKGAPNPSNDESFQGGFETVRFLGARGIFRNNLLVDNRAGNGWDGHASLNFSTFGNGPIKAIRYTGMRVYGNTFHGNLTSSIAFNAAPDFSKDLTDNRFANNVISSPELFGIGVFQSLVPWQGYRFTGNVVGSPSGRAVLRFGDGTGNGATFKDYEASNPQVFSGNQDGVAKFVNSALGDVSLSEPTQITLARADELWAAFQLTSDSPGNAQTTALTQVTAAVSNSATLEVEDVLWFSDGFGVTDGDEITINQNQRAKVLTRDVAQRRLTLDRPVTAAPGDPVTLSQEGASPGVFASPSR